MFGVGHDGSEFDEVLVSNIGVNSTVDRFLVPLIGKRKVLTVSILVVYQNVGIKEDRVSIRHTSQYDSNWS